MRYRVDFVADSALPEGVTWAFARQAGRTYLFIKESAISCEALSEAWECWQGAKPVSV